MKRGVYLLRPALKRVLWGGNKLQKHYGKDAAATESVGESWEVSAMPGMESADASTGLSLSALWAAERAHLAGPEASAEFPLLVKLLQCEQVLSVQVHPNDMQAQQLAGAPQQSAVCGKLEAWLVLESAPDAWILFGLAAGKAPHDLLAATKQGPSAVIACLQQHAVKPGQLWLVEPGTVHAPGPGIVMLEVQQPSDLTYRVYDWERRDANGQERTLHPAQALRVMAQPRTEGPHAQLDLAAPEQCLVNTHTFRMEHWQVQGAKDVLVPQMTVLHMLEGCGRISAMGDSCVLRKGATCLLPRGATIARIEGEGLRLAAITAPRSSSR